MEIDLAFSQLRCTVRSGKLRMAAVSAKGNPQKNLIDELGKFGLGLRESIECFC
jgi:hypothetical protein